MAGDGVGAIADAFDRWVDERADELGVSRETVLARVLAGVGRAEHGADGDDATDGVESVPDLDVEDAALVDRETLDVLDERVTALEGGESAEPDGVADLADRVEDLSERVDDLADRVEEVEGAGGDEVAEGVADLEADLGEKIQDVRERVIQVKREADAKAPADHDHEDLRNRTEHAAAAADELGARLDEVAERVDAGFENFEEVLEYLSDTSDDLEARAETLARATIGLRDRIADLETERSAREVAADIRATANRNGDATATCGACSRRVRLGLLSRPECPYCAATFEDVEPSAGLFGSATLRVGPLPALEGRTADEGVDDEDLFDEIDGGNGDGGDEP